ncbi:MAG TPA: M20/M25/M40 family metallo-hydrolase [Pirellulaceae bacterium]|jgi:hypothetical protein
MNRKLLAGLTLFAAAAICTSGSAVDRDALAAAAASITAAEAKTYVDVLADDTFEGRETGSRGGRAAGNYVLKAMEQLGALPAGENGSFGQSFHAASRNILGLVEGSDPRLKDQVIVLGAHYDHVGYGTARNSYGPTGYIHNGADDNASGVAGLLEVLDAVKRLPQAPRRSLLFAFWDSEEGGLHGSRTWVARPTVPLSKVVLDINMDMIGRMKNGRMELLGSRTAPGLRRLVSEANGAGPTTIDFDWKIKPDSDHWPFYEHRIPYLMFHTGLHGDYHRPSDDAHLVNYEGLATISKMIFEFAVRLADEERVPSFREAARNETASSPASLEQPASPQPPRFGLPFRIEAGDEPKFIVTALTAGSAAEKSGFRAGDRLLEFQGEPIRDDARFRLHLLAASGETTFLVQRPGSETPLLLKMTPAGDPIRVGITWRLDDGEPGTAIVTQVIYGSAAHAAGVKFADRLYTLGGKSFRTQDDLVKLLSTATSPLEMVLERDGRLRTATLTLLSEPPAAE